MRSEFKLVSINNLPDPPYPHDFIAGRMKFDVDMPRIKQSKTWLLCPAEFRNHLLRVWAESWESVPAGSYDDDDEIIAARIDLNFELFLSVKKYLMRGWQLHSDGKLYHPFITDMVMKIMSIRRNDKDRKREDDGNSKNFRRIPTEILKSNPTSSSTSTSSSSSSSTSPYPPEADPSVSGKSSQVDRKDTYCAERKIALHAGRQIPGIMMVNGQEFFPQTEEVQLWEQSFPAVDIMSELGRMRAWADANPKKRKTPHGMKKFIIGWLGREQDKGGNAAPERKNRQQSVTERNQAAMQEFLEKFHANERTLQGECHEID